MAKAMELKDPKNDKEEQKLLNIVLKKLESSGFSDMNWDESDTYESSYLEMGYTRYIINKKSLGRFAKETEDSEGLIFSLAVCFDGCGKMVQYIV